MGMNAGFILVCCLVACLTLAVFISVPPYPTPHLPTEAQRKKKKIEKVAQPDCQQLHFSEKQLPITALASYPGSGNTWLRHLLQQTTGIYTGSIYHDHALLRSGFLGEGVKNGSVIAIKTHEIMNEEKLARYDRCVLLIRDPAAALLSQFQEMHSHSHTGWARPLLFRRYAWRRFLEDKMDRWQWFYSVWTTFSGQMLVVQYEDLVQDLESEMTKILTFLGVKPAKTDIRCAIKNSEGLHKRPHWPVDFNPFTPEMRGRLEQRKEDVYSEFELLGYISILQGNSTS